VTRSDETRRDETRGESREREKEKARVAGGASRSRRPSNGNATRRDGCLFCFDEIETHDGGESEANGGEARVAIVS
jgi:hypothetical protein